MSKIFPVTLLLCAMLAACASGPAYRAAESPGGYGYRDTQLTNDHWRVSFSGGYATPRERVENFALFRAADLALAHGYQRFRVTSRSTSPITTQEGGFTPVFGYGFGYPLWQGGIGYSSGGVSRTRYETVLNIQLTPELPRQGANIYDAEQVKRNLSASIASEE